MESDSALTWNHEIYATSRGLAGAIQRLKTAHDKVGVKPNYWWKKNESGTYTLHWRLYGVEFYG